MPTILYVVLGAVVIYLIGVGISILRRPNIEQAYRELDEMNEELSRRIGE